jgi:NAD(P)-dependent dehydrogenase (short-subunit alcohol dehydrogenase family)
MRLEIGPIAAFLAAADSRYSTRHTLCADGGGHPSPG